MFTVQPKSPEIIQVGSEETGIISLLRFGYIRECEQSEIEQSSFELAQLQSNIYDLICKVAEGEKISVESAALIFDTPSVAIAILNKYGIALSQVLAIKSQMDQLAKKELAIFLKHRCVDIDGNLLLGSDFSLEEMQQQIQALPLIEELKIFMTGERTGIKSPKKSLLKSKSKT